MLRRIRGGALVAQRSDEGAFEFRQRVAAKAKRAIAQRAAQLVSPGDVIAMDSSTTCFYLANELVDIAPLTVVTNGLRTSALLLKESRATVIMPGGVLRRASESMVGFFGDVLEGRGQVDKGFFGVVGLSLQRGLLDLTPEEARAKEAMAAVCRQRLRHLRLLEGRTVRHPPVPPGGPDHRPDLRHGRTRRIPERSGPTPASPGTSWTPTRPRP